jgi:hypothetical protein
MAKTTTTAQPNTEWKNLHIFGYGETKLVSFLDATTNTENNSNIIAGNKKLHEKVAKTVDLTKAQALADYIYSKKPADSDAGVLFHAITFVKDFHCLYIPRNTNEKHFRIEYKDLDLALIQDLVSELQALA